MRNFLENVETQTFYYAIKRRPTVYGTCTGDGSVSNCAKRAPVCCQCHTVLSFGRLPPREVYTQLLQIGSTYFANEWASSYLLHSASPSAFCVLNLTQSGATLRQRSRKKTAWRRQKVAGIGKGGWEWDKGGGICIEWSVYFKLAPPQRMTTVGGKILAVEFGPQKYYSRNIRIVRVMRIRMRIFKKWAWNRQIERANAKFDGQFT